MYISTTEWIVRARQNVKISFSTFVKKMPYMCQKWVSLALFSILSAQNIIIGQVRLSVVWGKVA